MALCSPRLPRYACQFIEMCLMVTADHGPAVSGAHNTIVCARAGKDLISCLTSGLLTIVSTGLFTESHDHSRSLPSSLHSLHHSFISAESVPLIHLTMSFTHSLTHLSKVSPTQLS